MLQFDPTTHVYRLDNGRVIPGVTEILSALGISTDFEKLADRSRTIRAAIELKRDIGSALHADIHAYDDNDLDEATVDERVRPYLDAWKVFRRNLKIVPEARERRVFHAGLWYAGTLDGIFTDPARPGARILLDVKTGDPDDAGARYQLALYWLAFRSQYPDAPALTERWSVRLLPGAPTPYDIQTYNDWNDLDTARCIVTAYHARRTR